MNQMRGIDVLVLRDVAGMLVVLLHAPRGPFYSPKAARSTPSIPTTFLSTKTSISRIRFIVIASRALVELRTL